MKVHAELKNGALELDRILFAQLLKEMEDGKVEVSVKKWKSTRSLNQNRYYHGCVTPTLAEHCKVSVEMMHDILRYKFLKQELPPEAEQLSEFAEIQNFASVKSTTKLNTREFEEYMENCRRWAATLGCDVKEPNESEYAY